jgi:pyruvate-ferredoxin/flavodoxin oxidoreductase
MQNCQAEMKKAVEAGYWHMFRFNPALESGKLSVDSKAPTADYQAFIANEARYSRLAKTFPERAQTLFAQAEAAAKAKYDRLVKLGEFYK